MKRHLQMILMAALLFCGLVTGKAYAAESDFEYWVNEQTGGAIISGYNGTDREVSIPAEIDGHTVERIDARAFASNTEITGVTIPSTVNKIGWAAFSECTALSRVTFEDDTVYSYEGVIDGYAFSDCDSLKTLRVPQGVTTLNEYFIKFSGVTKVYVPDSVTYISDSAFGGVWPTIYGAEGTVIEQYAQENNKTFVEYTMNISNVTAENEWDGVTVRWTGIFDAARYRVSYRVSGTSTWTKAGETDQEEFEVTGLTSGKKYFYQVKALDANGKAVGNAGSTSASRLYLGEPKNISCTSTLSGMKVTWDPVPGAEGYKIYLGYSSEYEKLVKTVKSGDTTSCTLESSLFDLTSSIESFYICAYAGSMTGGAGWCEPEYVEAPTISSITNTTGGVELKWTTPQKYLDKFYIYRKSSSETSYKKIASVSGSTKSYKDDTAVSGKTYSYRVRAMMNDYLSSYRTKSILRLANTSSVTLSNLSSGLKLSWKAVTGAKSYKIYRKTSTGTTYKELANVSDGSLTYTDTTAYNGSTYSYRVRACSGTTLSGYSTYKGTRLTTPAISSLTSTTAGKMTVKWGANTKATGYEIRYSTDSDMPGGSYKTSTVTSADTVSKSIASLTGGKTYYVKVRSYKTVDGTKYYSGWSTKKSVKIG